MSYLIDSFSESNVDDASLITICSDASFLQGIGQTFYTGSFSGILDNCKWYIKKVLSPTGNATAKVYAITGTPGTNGKPTGAALATSDNFDVSTLTTSYQLIVFNFSGANRISFSPNTHYVLTLEYSGGDSSNFVRQGNDATTPVDDGNGSFLQSSAWSSSTSDRPFYVYGSSRYVGTHYYLSQGFQ